jgi:hypothetical protein
MLPPPFPVECLGHHFVDDELVARRFAAICPNAVHGGAGVSREAAETTCQNLGFFVVHMPRKPFLVVILQRQEALDQVHGAILRRRFLLNSGHDK